MTKTTTGPRNSTVSIEQAATRRVIARSPGGTPRLCHQASVYLGNVIISSAYPGNYNPDPDNHVTVFSPLAMRVNDDHQNGAEEWDKEIEPVPAESDLRKVTVTGVNRSDEPAVMSLLLDNPGKLSGNFSKNGHRMALPPSLMGAGKQLSPLIFHEDEIRNINLRARVSIKR